MNKLEKDLENINQQVADKTIMAINTLKGEKMNKQELRDKIIGRLIGIRDFNIEKGLGTKEEFELLEFYITGLEQNIFNVEQLRVILKHTHTAEIFIKKYNKK